MTQDIWKEMGLKRPTEEEMEHHSIATIGDVEVTANKGMVRVLVDGEIVLSIMRQDGGLQELVDALQSQVIK